MTRLGLFVDMRQGSGSPRSTAEHVSRTIDLLVGAEAQGCGSAWFTEHHGFADGYLPQPLLMAAAVAARTTTMRLGTGITLGPIRHPRHLAEEAALVDLISGGRLDLGIGAGYSQAEYEAFGADISRRFGATDSLVHEVRRLLDSGEVTPAPVQQPLPLWLGYQGPQGAGRAGRAGAGLLSLDPSLLEPYLAGLIDEGYDPATARMGGLLEIIVADDPEAATERLIPYWLHQQNSYRALMRKPDGSRLGPLDDAAARTSLAQRGRLGTLAVLDVGGAIAEVRSRLDGIPAEHAYTWLSVGDMPDDLVERHIELWCGPVRQAIAS